MTMAQEHSFRRVSVVIPVCNRHDDPEALFSAYRGGLSGLGVELEFIYVIDGAFPDVYDALKALRSNGAQIRIIKLAKSFGEAAALSVGFRYATGDAILTLPAFHQVEPSELPKLVQRLESADMVVGRRWPRSDSGLNRFQTAFFSRLVRMLTRSGFQDLGCNARAMRPEVCEEVLMYGEQHRFLPILAVHKGFRVAEIDLAQSELDGFRRVYAPGLYVRRMLDLLTVFFLVKFTKRPMRFFGLLGASMAGAGGLYILLLVFQRLFLEMPLADRPALLLSSLIVVLGVQVFAMGLIGELIIYTHARQLQEYAIEETVGGEAAPAPDADSQVSREQAAGSGAEPLSKSRSTG